MKPTSKTNNSNWTMAGEKNVDNHSQNQLHEHVSENCLSRWFIIWFATSNPPWLTLYGFHEFSGWQVQTFGILYLKGVNKITSDYIEPRSIRPALHSSKITRPNFDPVMTLN